MELLHISHYFCYKDGLKIDSIFVNNKYHFHIYGNKLMLELKPLLTRDENLREEAYEVVSDVLDKLPITTDIKITVGGKYKKVISFSDIFYNIVYLDNGTEKYSKFAQKIEDAIRSYLGNFDNISYIVERNTSNNEIIICLYRKVDDIVIEIPIELFIVHNKLHFESLLETDE